MNLICILVKYLRGEFPGKPPKPPMVGVASVPLAFELFWEKDYEAELLID